jgi:hypothetical protein
MMSEYVISVTLFENLVPGNEKRAFPPLGGSPIRCARREKGFFLLGTSLKFGIAG